MLDFISIVLAIFVSLYFFLIMIVSVAFLTAGIISTIYFLLSYDYKSWIHTYDNYSTAFLTIIFVPTLLWVNVIIIQFFWEMLKSSISILFD